MSELRQDITTGEWVIMAEDRAKRPNQNQEQRSSTPSSKNCPFCPGKEEETPKEIHALRSKGKANSPGWQVRVFSNKYPALHSNITLIENYMKLTHELYPQTQGFGFHEVIVETPNHDSRFADLSAKEIEIVLKTYQSRYHSLNQDPRIRFILPFRNQGTKAGATLFHPHSQILATPVIPMHTVHRFQIAKEIFKKDQKSIYRKILNEEQKIKTRVIVDSPHFLVFCPFASRIPYEIWIFPKETRAHFGGIQTQELKDLAHVLKETLLRLDRVLEKPDYNYAFLSAPHMGNMSEEDKSCFSWHIKIFPRLSTFAGFEISTGMTINTIYPEKAAKNLRDISL